LSRFQVERIAVKFINKYGFLWPSQLSRMAGISWYKSNKTLQELKKTLELRTYRVGRVKLYCYPLGESNEKGG